MDDESDTNVNAENSPEAQMASNSRREVRREERRKVRIERRMEREENRRVAINEVYYHLEALRDRDVTKARMIQIIIHANHHKGRDSHVRMVKVLDSEQQVSKTGNCFTTREFQMYETIR